MDYLDWNDKLCRHFFCKIGAAEVFPCVSKTTLSDVSGLNEEKAVSEFLTSVKKGPEWTQIPRCQNIVSKMHNCLYPDPDWKKREAGEKREKLSLTGHVYWSEYEGGLLDYPPYFAYLCLLVLSWTERNDHIHGGNFYAPLNRILELNGDQRIDALGTRYTYKNNPLTINNLWQDLQDWSLREQGPVLDLPPPERCANDYVYIARYYGLLNAADLRRIDCVLSELSEKRFNFESSTPENIALTVFTTEETRKLFSNDGRQVLGDEIRRAALGRLLLAKYKVWDGSPCEDYVGPLRGFHKLLRVVKKGQFYSLIKLRSILAMDRADIEEGVPYQVDTRVHKREEHYSAMWPLRSEFSSLFQIHGENPESSQEIWIQKLGLKARREEKRSKPLVFSKQTLVHLLEAHVEVDQVEPNRHYLLLERSENLNPVIRQYLKPDHATNCPAGYNAYTLFVPEKATDQWPDNQLPPLARDRSGGSPRIRVQSIFAIDKNKYLAGFPIRITSTSDNYAPRIDPPDIPHQISQGILDVTPSHAGQISISLDHVDENIAPIKINRIISIHEWSTDHLDPENWRKFELSNMPVYPKDKIRIIGNSFLYSHKGEAYYNAGLPVTISIAPEISAGGQKRFLRINGKDFKKPFTLKTEQVRDGEKVLITLFSGNEIIDHQRIIFRSKPQIHITGVSETKNYPKVLHGKLSFSAIPNNEDQLKFLSCSYLNKKQVLTLPTKDLNWIDYLTQYGKIKLPDIDVFHLDFILGDVVLKTCWFKTVRRPQTPQPPRPAGGLNNLGAFLEGL